MWFVILCSCKESYEGKKKQHLPPHWSCFRGVILSRIGVCTHCRNAMQHHGSMCNVHKMSVNIKLCATPYLHVS